MDLRLLPYTPDRDVYRLLGIPATASSDEISAACRRLARTFHPDRNRSQRATQEMQVVNAVRRTMTDPELRGRWESELAVMRDRIRTTRQQLRARLERARPDVRADHITTQNGMFSYLGLAPEQMVRLREEYGVYGLDSGRICVAAVNDRNLDTVVAALAPLW